MIIPTSQMRKWPLERSACVCLASLPFLFPWGCTLTLDYKLHHGTWGDIYPSTS